MINPQSEKEVFFHVGLGKTATTYLQYEFFPKLKGIRYIQRTKYNRFHAIISASDETRFLVSREFDQQLEDECQKISAHYPQGRVIIVLRSPESWIASQYRRFAKNGIHSSFVEFFDVEHDSGKWKREELMFSHKLAIIEKYFEHKPLVLFHEDLKSDSYGFFDTIAQFVGATYDRNRISLGAVHKSYSEKQLKAVRKWSRYLFPEEQRFSSNKVIHWLQWRKQQLTSYGVMFASLLMPDRWFDDIELIAPGELEKIREYFKEDYAACRAYAEANNPKGAIDG